MARRISTFQSKSIIVWSVVISALTTITSLLGLTDPTVYVNETRNWAMQAKGQDIGNLLAVISLLSSGFLYARGSFKAALIWVGTLLYLVYAFIIYGLAVHFNNLFIAYVAILGLSSYAIIFNIQHIRQIQVNYPDARKLAGYTLIALGVLFGCLWLSEIIPALLQGKVPQGIIDAGLGVNPVHVLDLSIVIPGFMITGFQILKRKTNGYFYAAPWLTFSALMGSSIVATLVLGAVGGQSTIPPMVFVSAVVIVSLLTLWRYLRRASG